MAGLQGRTRRTARQRAVDLPVQVNVEVAGRADEGLDAHVADIDEDRGRVRECRPCHRE